MANRVKRPRYFLDIEPELRNRMKAVASLHGKTMRDWVTEAIVEKLEDDIDAREGLAVLGEVEDTIPLRDGEISDKADGNKKALLAKMDRLRRDIGPVGMPAVELVAEGRRR